MTQEHQGARPLNPRFLNAQSGLFGRPKPSYCAVIEIRAHSLPPPLTGLGGMGTTVVHGLTPVATRRRPRRGLKMLGQFDDSTLQPIPSPLTPKAR